VVDDPGGRGIVCSNSSNVLLRIAPGLTVNRRGRRRYPPRTIFLDGVYGGAPFCDNEERHYSLDHHAGCVRGFTLATCEQAVVMLLQGMPLSVGEWTVYVNDPDLDSVLAAWVLMNHLDLLRKDRAALRTALPLIRLEGVIDAHGTDLELFAALPEPLHQETRATIDRLMKRERELKSAGKWFAADWIEYTRELLGAIDAVVFSPETLAELARVREVGQVSLGDRIALLLRSTDGIYAVEATLKERYGASIGLIVLELGDGRFTLRRVDTFLKRDLTSVYRLLNRRDPKARPDGDPPNLWGGSGDIGGAPRMTGTGLSGQEILEVVREVLGPQPTWFERAWNLWRRLREARSAAPTAPLLPPGNQKSESAPPPARKPESEPPEPAPPPPES
jgi:hypothetical protein